MLAVALMSGALVYNLHRRMHYEYAGPLRALVAEIEAVKRAHQDDPDFSFSVVPGDCPVNAELPWFAQYALEKRARYTIAFTLFPETERDAGGKYPVPCPR
jgi:hypothetical protein